MVRLTDVPEYERDHLLGKNLPPLGPACWTSPEKPLSQIRVALITTADYVESLTAQPGNYNQTEVYQTIWFETQLGTGLARFYEAFRAHPELGPFARIVLPREAVSGSTNSD